MTSTFVRFLAAASGALAASTAVAADAARIELHVLATTNLTDQQFLAGVRDGKPENIAAELRLPSGGTERLPAMVIVHGSAGVVATEDRWARELNELGIAALLIDGFTPRGITGAAADQSQLGNLTMINDAYRALELLAKHPRIDPSRIGLMGESRGGRVALYAAMERFQRSYAPSGAEFAIYLPFYAPCYTAYDHDTNLVDRPIRLFHGSADDYTPVDACRAYVARLKQAGNDVQLTEYVGAHHGFDNPSVPVRAAPRAQTARNCSVGESSGVIVNRATGRAFTWEDACVERGVTVGYDAAAHMQAIKDVAALLKQEFRLDSP